MKLGVGYIVFTGAEFLKPSLRNIRMFAHHIAVVWDDTSHKGHPAPLFLEPLLNQLQEEGLIDELIKFRVGTTTNPSEMQANCRTKRNKARIACRVAGCSHFMIRDCDEFHRTDALNNTIADGLFDAYDVVLTKIQEYWGSPLTAPKDLSDLHVPCIQRIELPLLKRVNPYGVKVDGGRTPNDVKTWRILTPDQLLMHHFTACRYNTNELRRKHQGHGHLNRNFQNGDEYIKHVDKLLNTHDTKVVEDIFGIMDYWMTEFRSLKSKYVETSNEY